MTMGISSQTVRLFISSTFSDFRHERDVLQNRVFPYLTDLCRAHGVEFQAVDLRWGIREEEAFEQRTLDICIREIQRCLEVSPQPNFLILIGERYGWQPLPSNIPVADFDAISNWLHKEVDNVGNVPALAAQAMLVRWYRLDSNALPHAYRLQPRSGSDVEFKVWEVTEAKLRSILRAAIHGLRWKRTRTDRYLLSATAQEIEKGVFGKEGSVPKNQRNGTVADVSGHVFCFHRKRLGVRPNTGVPVSRDFTDITGAGVQDAQALARLNELSDSLRHRLGNNYLTYQAFALAKDRNGGPLDDISKDHIETFASDAQRLLSAVIQSQIQSLESVTAIERECGRHSEFLRAKVRQFEGHSALLDRISTWLGQVGGPLVLHGRGGVGKSSVMAKVIDNAQKNGFIAVFRFLGLTSESSGGTTFLRSICEDIAVHLNGPVASHDDIAGWSSEFKKLVQLMAQAPSKFFIAIDAVDQLAADDPALEMSWLPKEFPANVRLVVSTVSGGIVETLQNRLLLVNVEEVGALESASGKSLLKKWLASTGRQLQDRQTEYVLDAYTKNGLPLYLRLAVGESQHWTSYLDLPDRPGVLPVDVEQLIQQIFARLELPKNHGKLVVRRALGYLVAAKNGLTESELIDVLSEDQQLMRQFRKDSPQGQDLKRLPFIVWSRLRDELEDYLSERQADGLPVIGFFHRIFKEVATQLTLCKLHERRFLHTGLAQYFSKQSNYLDADGQQRPNRRRLSELALHLLRSGKIDELNTLITDGSYFDAKLEIGARYELFTEYLQCRHAMAKDGATQKALRNLSGALANHVIRNTNSRPRLAIDIEDLHAYLAFRKDSALYREFLSGGIALLKNDLRRTVSIPLQRLYLGMQARQGNMLRRDGVLTSAKRLLTDLNFQMNAYGPTAERARVEYDLGYIAYLQGDLKKGAALIEQSAETAKADGNEVGYWISKCVAAHQRWLLAIASADGFKATADMHSLLDQALAVFSRRKYEDTTSERWVMNIYSHRFNLAFRAADVQTATAVFQMISNDPWLKGFGDDVTVARCNARLAILQGRYVEGAMALASIAMQRRKRSKKDEALAEDFMDAGFAYQLGGSKEAARKMWALAEKLPKSYGNRYWQNVISQQKQATLRK
jgi:hypothetical protein